MESYSLFNFPFALNCSDELMIKIKMSRRDSSISPRCLSSVAVVGERIRLNWRAELVDLWLLNQTGLRFTPLWSQEYSQSCAAFWHRANGFSSELPKINGAQVEEGGGFLSNVVTKSPERGRCQVLQKCKILQLRNPPSLLIPGGLWGCPASHWYNERATKRFPG